MGLDPWLNEQSGGVPEQWDWAIRDGAVSNSREVAGMSSTEQSTGCA